METHSSVPLWKACIGVFTMVLASGAAVTIAPAYAQPQISNESAQPEIWAPSVKAPIVQPSEQVTIEAPRYHVHRKAVSGRRYGLSEAEMISISRPVSYSDLNLSDPAQFAELEKRIRETAIDVCRELNRRYPWEAAQIASDRNCFKGAVGDAMAAAKKARDKIG